MRRSSLLLALALPLVAAGCLGALDDDQGPVDPAGNGAPGASTGAPRLGNLTMEGAQRERPNAWTVVFTWEDAVPASPQGAVDGLRGQVPTASTPFEVPSEAPFTVDATLTWEEGAGRQLTLELEAPDVVWLCQDTGAGEARCGVPSLPQDPDNRWSVNVWRANPQDLRPYGNGAEEIPFTVELVVRAKAPETVPDAPTLVPEAADDAPTVDPGWPDPSEASVRPGAKIVAGELLGFEPRTCTANFVFSTPDNATLYVGTASHCVQGANLGDEVSVGEERIPGTLAYCSYGAAEGLLGCPRKSSAGGPDSGWRDDLALVVIPDEHRGAVHPAGRVWGGPTALGDPPEPGTRVLNYGNTPFRDADQDVNVLDSRPGVVRESGEKLTRVHFAGPGVHGDSGSPVITEEGAAVGNMHGIGLPGEDNLPGGDNSISNLAHSLSNLKEITGRTVDLKTWPLFEPPRPER